MFDLHLQLRPWQKQNKTNGTQIATSNELVRVHKQEGVTYRATSHFQ